MTFPEFEALAGTELKIALEKAHTDILANPAIVTMLPELEIAKLVKGLVKMQGIVLSTPKAKAPKAMSAAEKAAMFDFEA